MEPGIYIVLAIIVLLIIIVISSLVYSLSDRETSCYYVDCAYFHVDLE